MKLEIGTRCPFHIDEGVMIDYVEDQWLILIKDALWQPEEIKAFRRNPGRLAFLPLDTAVLFTVNVDDVLETSDLPFVIQECENAQTLFKQPEMAVTLALISAQDEVIALRQLTLSTADAAQVKNHLKRILDAGYDQTVSNHQIDKTQARYQPYELEEKALFTAAF